MLHLESFLDLCTRSRPQFTISKTHFMAFSETYEFPNGTVTHDGSDHYVVEYLRDALNLKIRSVVVKPHVR